MPSPFFKIITSHLLVQSGKLDTGDICLKTPRISKANEIAAKYEAGLSKIFVFSGFCTQSPLRTYKSFIYTSHQGRLPIGGSRIPWRITGKTLHIMTSQFAHGIYEELCLKHEGEKAFSASLIYPDFYHRGPSVSDYLPIFEFYADVLILLYWFYSLYTKTTALVAYDYVIILRCFWSYSGSQCDFLPLWFRWSPAITPSQPDKHQSRFILGPSPPHMGKRIGHSALHCLSFLDTLHLSRNNLQRKC